MPNQMLRYRAAAFWQRVYCPEISMGLMTKEEIEDAEVVPYEDVSDDLSAIAAEADNGTTPAPQQTDKAEADGKEAPQPTTAKQAAKQPQEGKLL